MSFCFISICQGPNKFRIIESYSPVATAHHDTCIITKLYPYYLTLFSKDLEIQHSHNKSIVNTINDYESYCDLETMKRIHVKDIF